MPMNVRRRLLPPISALAAFEAASRLGSVTHAAGEIGVTQGAVSRSIKVLEDFVGTKLFTRGNPRIALTPAGQAYANEIRAALGKISAATFNVTNDLRGGVLNVAILPGFGSRWLIPRMPQFLARHPEVTINFFTRYYQPIDFETENFDIGIYYGNADMPGAICDLLLTEEVVPVCAPGFRDLHAIREPSDLLRVPLLHEATRPNGWPDWFAANGITMQSAPGLVIEQFSIVAQAAVAGLGAAVLPLFLIEVELDRGDLVVAVDRPLTSARAYYLVHPADKTDYSALQTFRQWLLDLVHS